MAGNVCSSSCTAGDAGKHPDTDQKARGCAWHRLSLFCRLTRAAHDALKARAATAVVGVTVDVGARVAAAVGCIHMQV